MNTKRLNSSIGNGDPDDGDGKRNSHDWEGLASVERPALAAVGLYAKTWRQDHNCGQRPRRKLRNAQQPSVCWRATKNGETSNESNATGGVTKSRRTNEASKEARQLIKLASY